MITEEYRPTIEAIEQELNNRLDQLPVPNQQEFTVEKKTYFRPKTFTASNGINPLTTAAAALFSLIPRLEQTQLYDAPDELYLHLAHELEAFTSTAESFHYSSRIIFLARYLLCSFIDETLMFSVWGRCGLWEDHRLVCKLLNEDISPERNGERVFSIIDRICKDPSQYIDLLEFSFLCLSLGLQGQYRHIDNGQEKRQGIINHLYYVIRMERGHVNYQLAQQTAPVAAPKVKHRYGVLAVVASLILLAGSYLGFNYLLEVSAHPLQQQLQAVKNISFHINEET